MPKGMLELISHTLLIKLRFTNQGGVLKDKTVHLMCGDNSKK